MAFFKATRSNETPKAELPLWTAATYDPPYVADKNVQRVYALTFDVDEDPIPSADALRALPWLCVVSTSPSSTAAARRYRLAIAISRPVTGEEYRRIWSSVARVLPFAVGKAARNPSRGWYAPRVGPDGSYECFEGDNTAPLDVDAVLAEPAQDPSKPAPAPTPVGGTLAPAAAALAAAWPPRGKRADARLALLGACKREGMAQADAAAFVKQVHAALADRGDATDADLDAMAATTYARGDAPTMGWTALQRYVPASVVRATRELLNPFADFVAERVTRDKPTAIEPTGDEWSKTTKWGGWSKKPDPPLYLVDGLMPAFKVITLFAEGGSLKTWAGLALAVAVATGKPWLGLHCVRRGKALYLDWEDGPYEFGRRVHLLTQGDDVPGLGYRYAGPQIDKPAFWEGLEAFVKTNGITLVVFDSLGASMPGDAEENETAFAMGVKMAGRFTEVGCTVVFVHHANKTGGLRGTSAIRDQSDCVFNFEPVSETEDVKRMRMVCDKPGPQRKPKPVNIELAATADGITLGTFEGQVDKEAEGIERAMEAVLATLRRTPEGLTRAEVLAETKGTQAFKRPALRALLANGTVQETGAKLYLRTNLA